MEKETKTTYIRARVTPTQKEEYMALAEREGLTISQLIIALLNKENHRD